MFVLSKKTKPKTANLLCDKPNRWAGYTHFGKGTIRTKDGSLVERNIKPIPEFSPRNNIWKYNTGKNYSSKDDAAFEHPAIFPETLAKDHILTWSNEGDLVLIQYGQTEKERELSGFVTSVNSLLGGVQTITLSKTPTTDLNNQGYILNVYHLETGNVETNKPFTGVVQG